MSTTPEKNPEIALIEALVKFQSECHAIAKDSRGKVAGTSKAGKAYSYDYTYLSLAKLREETAPALAKNGLAVTQVESFDEGYIVLLTKLVHVAGASIEAYRPVCTIDAALADAQRYGSALSYARRYSYNTILGIAPEDEDDDGGQARGMDKTTKPRAAAKPKADAKPKDEKPKNFTIQFVSEQGEVEEVTFDRTPANIKGMIERFEKSQENDNGVWWGNRSVVADLCGAHGKARDIPICSPSLGDMSFGEWADAQEAAHGEPEG